MATDYYNIMLFELYYVIHIFRLSCYCSAYYNPSINHSLYFNCCNSIFFANWKAVYELELHRSMIHSVHNYKEKHSSTLSCVELWYKANNIALPLGRIYTLYYPPFLFCTQQQQNCPRYRTNSTETFFSFFFSETMVIIYELVIRIEQIYRHKNNCNHEKLCSMELEILYIFLYLITILI